MALLPCSSWSHLKLFSAFLHCQRSQLHRAHRPLGLENFLKRKRARPIIIDPALNTLNKFEIMRPTQKRNWGELIEWTASTTTPKQRTELDLFVYILQSASLPAAGNRIEGRGEKKKDDDKVEELIKNQLLQLLVLPTTDAASSPGYY